MKNTQKVSPLIPGHNREISKQREHAVPQSQSLESLMLQMNDHVRMITKSLSAIGDITTVMYNEIVSRAQKEAQALNAQTPPKA